MIPGDARSRTRNGRGCCVHGGCFLREATGRGRAATLEVPKKIGPYRIIAAIGRGGMGIVYRGVDFKTGEEAAVKTVRGAREGMLSGIRREIRALARLRHPGIIGIVGHGIEQGVPWYAMELLEGETLSRHTVRLALEGGGQRGADDWAEGSSEVEAVLLASSSSEGIAGRKQGDAGDLLSSSAAAVTGGVVSSEGKCGFSKPSAPKLLTWSGDTQRRKLDPWFIRHVLTLIRRLCAPLSFLHGEGIVHLDLKPGNILVQSDGNPVLVDFGLVSRFGGGLSREALEPEWTGGGTPHYMAPEKLLGELVDARADLYGLGCILYELLVGRPPFLGRTKREVARRHLTADPVAPSKLVEGVPVALDELILGLLEKNPQNRVGYAADVASALGRLGAEEPLWPGMPTSKPYLYRPEFAGRTEFLEYLAGHFARLRERRGSLVLIGGEPGVGKTRLVMELGFLASAQKMRVMTGECVAVAPTEEGAEAAVVVPLHGFKKVLQAIGDRCRALGEEETERLLGRRGRVLARYERSLEGLPGLERHSEPPELPPEAARNRLFLYLTSTLAALAHRRPVLVLLDDLHVADELTLGFLGFLLRHGWLEKMPVMIVGTYRTEKVGQELKVLLETGSAATLELERLDEEAVSVMLRSMLAMKTAPPAFVDFLARQSEGNPFFVSEYLGTAVGVGILYRDEQGRWQIAETREAEVTAETFEALPFPRSLRELIEERFESLAPLAHRLLECAAVLGRKMEERALMAMARSGPEDLSEALEELLGQQILEEVGDGGLRFEHEKFREVAYEQMEYATRGELHRRAGEVLSLLSPKREERDYRVLAFHFERAGDLGKACWAYEEAGDRMQERRGAEEALRLYEKALALSRDSEGSRMHRRRAVLRLKRARILEEMGQDRRALQVLGLCEAEARAALETTVVLEALEIRAKILARLGAFPEALQALDQALALAHRRPEQKTKLLEQLGLLWNRLGEKERRDVAKKWTFATVQEPKNLAPPPEALARQGASSFKNSVGRCEAGKTEGNGSPVAGEL